MSSYNRGLLHQRNVLPIKRNMLIPATPTSIISMPISFHFSGPYILKHVEQPTSSRLTSFRKRNETSIQVTHRFRGMGASYFSPSRGTQSIVSVPSTLRPQMNPFVFKTTAVHSSSNYCSHPLKCMKYPAVREGVVAGGR